MSELTGGCLCGAIRFKTLSAPTRTINCHCESCRKHTGAPMATLPVYPANQVLFSGDDRTIYESSDNVGRAFCATCGTSMTFEANLDGYGPICAIHISTFDDPDALTPDSHSFYLDRITWYDSADSLPRYEGFVRQQKLVRTSPAIGGDR
ncbi:MAG: GFA family protein [Pseudomonadota bacterium]